MSDQLNSRTTGWLNKFEVILLIATAIVSGFVSILDFLGLLDGIEWLADRIPTLTLLVSASIAIYLIIERRNHLETTQKETLERFEKLEHTVISSTAIVVDSLQGLELKKFENSDELMTYVNKRLAQAQRQIDDLTWSPTISYASDLPSARGLNVQYTDRVNRISQKLPYREVFMFNRPSRLEKLKKLLEHNSPGYSCAYYPAVPVSLLQFMIIDQEEVIFLSDQIESRIAIRHPHIVKLFCQYYEDIWRNAIPIKLGTKVQQNVIDELFQSYPGD